MGFYFSLLWELLWADTTLNCCDYYFKTMKGLRIFFSFFEWELFIRKFVWINVNWMRLDMVIKSGMNHVNDVHHSDFVSKLKAKIVYFLLESF